MAPAVSTIVATLVNPDYPPTNNTNVKDVAAAARVIGTANPFLLEATSESGIYAAFAAILREQAGALLIAPDPFFIEPGAIRSLRFRQRHALSNDI